MFTLALNPSVHPLMLCNFSSSETAEYDMRDDFACNIDIFPCVYVGVNERVSGVLPAAEFAQAGAVCRERVCYPARQRPVRALLQEVSPG